MKKNKITAIIAIMLLAFLTVSNGATTPALASIGQAFPNVDRSTLIMLSTLPMLALVPFSILSGKLAGNKIKYRTLALVGSLFIVVAGISPYFLNDFYAILIARGFCGVGVGLVSPLYSTLILNLFEGKMRENLMGTARFVASIGGMIFQMLGGLLCAINWRYTFFTYILCAIAFVLIFFMLPEPPKIEKQVAVDGVKQKGGITRVAFAWIILYTFLTFFTYPFYVNMSLLVAQNNLGTAAASGFILTMSSVGGMIASTLFGAVFRFAKRKTLPIGFSLCAVTFTIMIFGNSVPAFAVAAAISGFAFGLIYPAILMYVGLEVTPAARAFAMALMMALPDLAMFSTSYFFSFIKSAFNITYDRYIFVIGLVFYIVCIIVLSFVKVKAKEDEAEIEAEIEMITEEPPPIIN